MTNRNEFQEKDMAKAALLYGQAQAEIDALQGENSLLTDALASYEQDNAALRARVAELEAALKMLVAHCEAGLDDESDLEFARAALGSKP